MDSRRKLLIAFGAGALAVTAILGHLLWSGYREAIHTAQVTTSGYAAVLETRLDATLRRVDAVLQQVVHKVPLAAMNQDAVSRNTRLGDEMKAELINFPELGALNLFDANGDLLYTSGDSAARPNISDREHFRALRDNPRSESVFSRVIMARTTGRPSVTFARAV